MSWHRQSLVARRVTHFSCEVWTEMEFSPETFQQMAGLVIYYDALNFMYLHLTRDDGTGQNCLRLAIRSNGEFCEPIRGGFIPLGGTTHISLRAVKNVFSVRFSYSVDGREWNDVCGEIDGSNLCDEAYRAMGLDGHTGVFAGMACTDLSGRGCHADFRSFSYMGE